MVRLGGRPWVKYVPQDDQYGCFVVEPLERGFGSTLGNSLRRVLLSSLSGAAITSVKIEGASHEYSTVPGMIEDVLQVILNLKEIVIKSHAEGPKIIKLNFKGKGAATAAEIEHDAEIEIINKDKVIANFGSSGALKMEMVVERGKGFKPAEQNKKSILGIDTIPVDAIFSPIKKVNLSIEDVRVGQEINYDKLVVDVWSNGSINPEEAVKQSAKILAEHIALFENIGQKVEEIAAPTEEKTGKAESILDMSVEDLELSARSTNCLKEANIKSVGELIKFSKEEVMNFKNFGMKSLNEVIDKLAEYKLTLREDKVETEEKGE